MTGQVTFNPYGITVRVEEGENLLRAPMDPGVHINAPCGDICMIISEMLRTKRTLARSRMTFSENILDAPMQELVCYCSGVSKARVLEAARTGAGSLDEIKAMTGACTVGRCKELSPRKR